MAAGGTLYEERRLAALDGLRGVAVLLVLWYHVWEISWLPAPLPQLQFLPETGFVGVYLFFFLSGFVISYPFVRALVHGTARPAWRHFAWRRFIKIVPSYLLSIAVAYAIGYAHMQDSVPAWKAVLTHVLFVHTWFNDTYGSINGVLWTLAVEVEFYLLFPLIWWCFARAPWLTAATMTAIALLWRLGLERCCYHSYFPTYSQNLPGYLDIFACGMLAAWIYCAYAVRFAASRARALAPLLFLAGVAMAVALLESLYAFRYADQWQNVWDAPRRELFGIAFGAIALGALWSARGVQMVLANRVLIFLGVISYNLYLYHQMLARELLWNHIPPHPADYHADPHWQLWFTLTAFVATIAEAAFVTYLFERLLLKRPDPKGFGALSGLWRSGARH